MGVRGAQEIGLDAEYIAGLRSFKSQPFLKFAPDEAQLKAIDAKLWSMDEVVQHAQQNEESCTTVVKGIVLALKGVTNTPGFKPRFQGKDVTLTYIATRWAFSSKDNCAATDKLEQEQKAYINHSLQEVMADDEMEILRKLDP